MNRPKGPVSNVSDSDPIILQLIKYKIVKNSKVSEADTNEVIGHSSQTAQNFQLKIC